MSDPLGMPDAHVRVTTKPGNRFIYTWNCSGRFTGGGRGGCRDAEIAQWQKPTWEDQEDLEKSIVFQFTDGNYGCDCNMAMFVADSRQEERPELECGSIHMPVKLEIWDGRKWEEIWRDDD